MFRLDAMARSVSLDEPWTGKRARSWDARTVGAWIDTQAPTETAHLLLGAVVRGLMTSDPSEVSLLDFLYLVRSAGNLNSLLAVEGGYQQDRISGGAQAIADRMARELGDTLHLSAPVAAIAQDSEGATVESATRTVHARRVIVTAPPMLAARIRFEPALPPNRAQLLDRMPAGATIKFLAVYEDAFWRSDGLSGQSVALKSPIELTLDASPENGNPGILAAFAFGPPARKLAGLTPDARRTLVLAAMRSRFGARAQDPIYYEETDWEREEWTRGCYFAHLAPGVWTQYGHVLRAPTGRVHWAGTETATVSHGTIDGAIRSGDRVAREVLALSG
jgi:monoamine oxidase